MSPGCDIAIVPHFRDIVLVSQTGLHARERRRQFLVGETENRQRPYRKDQQAQGSAFPHPADLESEPRFAPAAERTLAGLICSDAPAIDRGAWASALA
jgi:hypothetical protein